MAESEINKIQENSIKLVKVPPKYMFQLLDQTVNGATTVFLKSKITE